jgi:hypothetical protein
MNEELPFEESWINEKESIRIFKTDVFDEELKWHFDDEDRIIEALEYNDWKFQFDNEFPININKKIEIPRGLWHRLIKGSGDLKLSIKRI